MTTLHPTVQWLESSLQSPPEFRIPFESSKSKTSLPSSSSPWPWPPFWPRGYWGRPGPGPHIYLIVFTFQIGKAAAGTEKGKICLFRTSGVCWAKQDVEALSNILNNLFKPLIFKEFIWPIWPFENDNIWRESTFNAKKRYKKINSNHNWIRSSILETLHCDIWPHL